jgi:hypothetical protein
VTLSVCLGKRDASSAVVVVGLGGDDEAGKSSMVVPWISSSTATPRSKLASAGGTVYLFDSIEYASLSSLD